jgi:hypothetical protein
MRARIAEYFRTSITLHANQPVNGIGVGTVISGLGGCVADLGVYNTLFTGQVGTNIPSCGRFLTSVVVIAILDVSYIWDKHLPSGYVMRPCQPHGRGGRDKYSNRQNMDGAPGSSKVATSSADVKHMATFFSGKIC